VFGGVGGGNKITKNSTEKNRKNNTEKEPLKEKADKREGIF